MAMNTDTCLRLKQNSNFRCSCCKVTHSSREDFLKHLKYVSSKSDNIGITEHVCGSCSISFGSAIELVDHLETGIHIASLHNCACQGMVSGLREHIINEDGLSQRCSSHYSQHSLKHMGYSPLHCATMNDFVPCVLKLLKWGANANLPDESGCTPLHLAMVRGNIKVIMALLRYGGNLFQTDHEDKTPFDMADVGTKYNVLMKLFYFEGKDGKFVPTHIRNPDIAKRVAEHYIAFTSQLCDGNMNAETSSSSLSSEVVESTATHDGATIAEVFEMLLNHDVIKAIYHDVVNHCKERVPHFKLLVLGDVATGKTSLVRTLSGKEFCAERHATDGIDSSFLETISIDDSWQEICDKDLTYHDVVAKSFINKLKITKVVQTLSEEIYASLPGSFSRKLSIADSESTEDSSSTKDSAIATATVPVDAVRKSIDEPVKERIQEYLGRSKNLQDNQFKITILDFAGHTLYHPMHHIFLNDKALYLICFDLQMFKNDTKESLNRILFWLNSVVAHTGHESAVFLVGTHADSVEPEDTEKANRDIRENLYERFMDCFIFNENDIIFTIENSKGPQDPRAKRLRQKIQSEAQEMSSEGDDEIPIKWLRCENFIQEMVFKDKALLSLTKDGLRCNLESFCEEFDDDDYQKMLQMFHDSGVIWLPEMLFGKEEANGRFSNLVILNVQHLMDAMTSVFKLAREDSSKAPRLQRRTSKLLKESAKISHEDLKKVLVDSSAPAEEVIELLVVFHIIVHAERINKNGVGDALIPCQSSTPKAKTSRDESAKMYIIPSLLPEESLNDSWIRYKDPAGEHIFYIDFCGFPCEALFHQLLVRLADQSARTESIDPIIKRYDGIFGWCDVMCYRLEYDKSSYIVKGTICKLQTNKSSSCKDILVFLQDTINEICDDFFHFQKFKFMVPCPNTACERTNVVAINSQIAFDLANSHLLHFNPMNPKQQFCGRNPINLSDWGDHIGAEARTVRLPSNSFNGDHQELQSSLSVDSGVSEPLSASLIKVKGEMLTCISEHIGNTWSQLARHLPWPEEKDIDAHIDEVRSDYPNNQTEQAYNILVKWKRTVGGLATVDMLEKALGDCSRKDVADKLTSFF